MVRSTLQPAAPAASASEPPVDALYTPMGSFRPVVFWMYSAFSVM